ncbi:MAG TPA: polyphosphate kinase 2 family protein [Gemmatimonadales bacterium]|nr:polyphosphate kinase 2 family protein [Gemmatimonadales bacterium]
MGRAGSFTKPYRVTDGQSFRLADHDPDSTDTLDAESAATKQYLQNDIQRMAELQTRLYAENRSSLLIVLQAMDGAGKDSTIKHVMSGVNPQGCQVYSFKPPSEEELDHDFLWRIGKALPERGRIGIFNRSHYEEVLVVRVHPELLERQRLPAGPTGKEFWEQRYESINAFEQHLVRNGTAIVKFFLHISKDEQARRFLGRLDDPAKSWKFSAADVREREFWDDYMSAYEQAIRHTASEHAPWYVVPANHKWFARLVVAAAVVDALERLDPKYPALSKQERAELEGLRAQLEREAGATKGNGKKLKRT